MIPDDLALWRRLQEAGETTPWPGGLRFLADGEQPTLLDTSYLSEADRAVPSIAANVEATRATARLVTWAAEDDQPWAYGYWRGPGGTEPAEAPIVTLDSEGQFYLIYGASLSEALCWIWGEYADGGYAEVAEQCRALGVTITVDDPDDFPEPTASPAPGEHQRDLYHLRLAEL